MFTKEGEGRATGLLLEGERRFLDVMVKDAQRYRSTGGWGDDHFDRDDKTSRLTTCSVTSDREARTDKRYHPHA